MLPNQDHVADILQSCLEMFQKEQGTISDLLEQYPDYRDDIRPELEAANWLLKQSQVFDPRPGFVSASQSRLVSRIRDGKMAENPLVRDSAQVDVLTWLGSLFGRLRLAPRYVIAIILVISFFVGTSGVALASQDALPGEALYSMKLAVEDLSLAVTLPVAGDARLHIQFAERRLIEIQALLIEERYDEIGPVAGAYKEQIRLALKDINSFAVTEPQMASQVASLLENALAVHAESLAILSEDAPQPAQAALQYVILVSEQGGQAAHEFMLLAPVTPSAVPLMQPSGTVTPQPALSTANGSPTATVVPATGAKTTPVPSGTPQVIATQPAPVQSPPTLAPTTPAPTAPPTPAPTVKVTEPSGDDSETPGPKVTKPPNPHKVTAQAKKTTRPPQNTPRPKPTQKPKSPFIP